VCRLIVVWASTGVRGRGALARQSVSVGGSRCLLNCQHEVLETVQAVDLRQRIQPQGAENGNQSFRPTSVQSSFQPPQTPFGRSHLLQHFSQNVSLADLRGIPDSSNILQNARYRRRPSPSAIASICPTIAVDSSQSALRASAPDFPNPFPLTSGLDSEVSASWRGLKPCRQLCGVAQPK